MAKSQQTQAPSQVPASIQVGQQGLGSSKPEELGAGVSLQTAAGSMSTPQMDPPAELSVGGAVGAWLSDKRFTATWGVAESRNAWVHVDTIGWKKLANTTDSSFVALTMLAAHARQLNRPVNYREEADGMIRELYVW